MRLASPAVASPGGDNSTRRVLGVPTGRATLLVLSWVDAADRQAVCPFAWT